MSLAKEYRKPIKPRKTYRDALSKDQIPKMKEFLETLVIGAVLARQAGIKVDAGKCIDAWR